MKKMPAVFVGHGSPMIALDHNELTETYRRLGERILAEFGKPKAILMVSAHWYTRGTLVQSAAKPRQVYDMYGFPKESTSSSTSGRQCRPDARGHRPARHRRRSRRQLGHRPRHLEHPRPHLPQGRHPRRPASVNGSSMRASRTSSAKGSPASARRATSSWAAATSSTTCASRMGE